MPILTIQQRARELGRIRMGVQEEYEKDGRTKRRPAKLETFRLTSATREYVEAAAEIYHGDVRPWASPRGPEWEVIVEAPALDVIIPPDQVIDQWYELWSGGGCQRRCDGITEQLTGTPCKCPADPKVRMELAGKGNACKATTRLNVALPALPDLGVWRLETHSYYGAVELMGTAELLRQATAAGVLVRARLRIDRRQVNRPGEPRKDFIVPVLEIPDVRLDALLPAGPIVETRQLGSGAPAVPPRPALPPGPALPAQSTLRPPAPVAVAEPVTGGLDQDDEAAVDAVWRDAEPEQPAAPAELTSAEFAEFLSATGISNAAAKDEAARMFPDVDRLDAPQRAQLRDRLAALAKE